MKIRLTLCLITTVFVAALAWAATNLNSSKSNIYRLTYPTDLVSRDQAQALLAELDKLGRVDDVMLKQWLPAAFDNVAYLSHI